MALTLDPNVFTVDNATAADVININPLPTDNDNNIIVLFIHAEQESTFVEVTGVTDSSGLIWARRHQVQWGNDSDDINNTMEIWWAHAPNALTGDAITIQFSGVFDDASCTAISINGANTTDPWDQHPALPMETTNITSTPDNPTINNVFTDAEDTILFQFFGSGSNNDPLLGVSGGGFTQISQLENSGGSFWSQQTVGYDIIDFAVAGASISMTGDGFEYGYIVDAIRAASETTDDLSVSFEDLAELNVSIAVDALLSVSFADLSEFNVSLTLVPKPDPLPQSTVVVIGT